MTGLLPDLCSTANRLLDRRVILKASASFGAMAALGGIARHAAFAQDNAGGTIAGKWIEEENVGAFGVASETRLFQADFPFYAIAPHWGGDGDPSALVEMQFSADGESWTEPLAVGVAHEDAGPSDREGRNFGRLTVLESGASYVQYRPLDASGAPASLPTLAFTYIDATDGPSMDDQFSIAAVSPTTEPPPIISREAWGANERYRHEDKKLSKPIIWPPEYQRVEHVIIHHSATPNFQDPMTTVRSIYYYHAVERGWGDIGYNYLVDWQGNVYEGRVGGDDVIGGHAYEYANGSSGICTIGNFMKVEPTAEALAGLIWITAWVGRNLDPHGVAPFHEQPRFPSIAGHRDCYPQGCPGDMLYVALEDIREAVAQVLSYQVDSDSNPTFSNGDEVRIIIRETNLRSGPGTTFSILRELPYDSRFIVNDGPVSNGDYTWYKVTGELGLGWCVESNLERTSGGASPEFQVGDTVVVDTDVLNMRSSPGTFAAVIAQIVTGDVGTVVDGPDLSDGYNWYRLETDDGTGWCVSDYLALVEGPTGRFQTGDIVRVDTDWLRLRRSASISASTVASMPFGTPLEVNRSPVSADGFTWY
ncbi:MAG: hypothetical protein QOF33_4178, partial [Thermomicrobiales bacterium]|nr:hypothetical protein [Thermomicrobiales bacterium]